ncbi:MAG: hypothetical protein H7Y09_08155 [Chitinophagaceae bacterium]|nr:hypothetical protein [Anaerolineae bacterium]
MSDMPPEDARALYDEIRKHIEDRFEMRTQFFGNFASFLFAMFMLWFIFLEPTSASFRNNGLGALISVGWAIGIMVHFVNWIFGEMRENAISREMERAGLRAIPRPSSEKAKRAERLVRLSEDGELEEFDAEEMGSQKSSRQ